LLNIDRVVSSETPNVKIQIHNKGISKNTLCPARRGFVIARAARATTIIRGCHKFYTKELKRIRIQCAIQISVWLRVSAVGYDTRLRMPGNQENSPGTPGRKSGRNLADDLLTNYSDNLHPDALIF